MSLPSSGPTLQALTKCPALDPISLNKWHPSLGPNNALESIDQSDLIEVFLHQQVPPEYLLSEVRIDSSLFTHGPMRCPVTMACWHLEL